MTSTVLTAARRLLASDEIMAVYTREGDGSFLRGLWRITAFWFAGQVHWLAGLRGRTPRPTLVQLYRELSAVTDRLSRLDALETVPQPTNPSDN